MYLHPRSPLQQLLPGLPFWFSGLLLDSGRGARALEPSLREDKPEALFFGAAWAGGFSYGHLLGHVLKI